jgi:hypothetical protein
MKTIKHVIVQYDGNGKPSIAGYEFEQAKKPSPSPDFKQNLINVLEVRELLQAPVDPVAEFEADAEKARIRTEHQVLLQRVIGKNYGHVVR